MTIKRILLIGKTGQLGEAIMAEAKSFGLDIVGFGKEEMNVINRSQVEEKLDKVRPGILINTSAYHVMSQCEENPLEAMEINFLAVQNLARLCKKKNIIFVTYSTDYVFGGEKGKPYIETDLPHPLQVYGFSKLAGEYAALSIHPGRSLIIRSCGIFGGKEGSKQKGGNFVLNMLREARDKEIIDVSSEQIVNPTFAGDLSGATLKLLNSNAEPGIYHLASEGRCSWYEFAKEIFRLAGATQKLIPVDRNGLSGKMKRPKFSVLKNTKAKALGIELPSWQEGLESYFNFLNSI